jgi:hypothetical protein
MSDIGIRITDLVTITWGWSFYVDSQVLPHPAVRSP